MSIINVSQLAGLTRQDAAKLISQSIGENNLLLGNTGNIPDRFDDIFDVTEEYAYHIEKTCLLEIIKPKNTKWNVFHPTDIMTKDEADMAVAAFDSLCQDAQSASSVFYAQDILNSPSVFVSNMTSMPNNALGYGTLSLTPYKNHSAPWYFGIDAVSANINRNALSWVKLAYKGKLSKNAKLVISSPVFEASIAPHSISEYNGFNVLTFYCRYEILKLFEANLTLSPYENKDTKVKQMLHLKSVNGRYLRMALYPFDEEDETAELLYLGFFAQRSQCDEFIPQSIQVYHPKLNYSPLTDELRQSCNEAIRAKAKEIYDSPSLLLPEDIKGTCYYVSSINGNDNNDGLSPQTAWKTLDKLVESNTGNDSFSTYKHVVKSGDAVFLERGSVFNATLHTRYTGDFAIFIVDGVDYGAYGVGEKPIITNCVDPTGQSKWTKTEWENVWRCEDKIINPPCALELGYSDAGNVIVYKKDGTVCHGIKMLADDPYHPYDKKTSYLGLVTNGKEIFYSGGKEFSSPGCLENELEYFHDWTTGYVYMYTSQGNPQEAFDKVIITKRGAGFFEGSDSIIDNIAFKHIGTFGISVSGARNLVITNCTFEWIGGSIQGGTTVYGGAIQNWCDCDKFHVIHCCADQMLDAAFSTQGGFDQKHCIMNDVVIKDCVATRTNSSVELWNNAENKLLSNVIMSDNYFGYDGYHFGNRKVLKDACVLQLGTHPGQRLERVIYERNLTAFASSACFWARPFKCRGDLDGTLLRDNFYLLSNKKAFMITSSDMRCDKADPSRHNVMIDEDVANFQHELGLDVNSTFNVTNGYVLDGEEDGLYLPPYMVKK